MEWVINNESEKCVEGSRRGLTQETIPCAAHSLNLVRTSAAESRKEACWFSVSFKNCAATLHRPRNAGRFYGLAAKEVILGSSRKNPDKCIRHTVIGLRWLISKPIWVLGRNISSTFVYLKRFTECGEQKWSQTYPAKTWKTRNCIYGLSWGFVFNQMNTTRKKLQCGYWCAHCYRHMQHFYQPHRNSTREFRQFP
jgi:hypothetical protein